ncbi:hypothetical protein OIDMADRAFT_21636 [Oidiodendron maius Zn]|uniref:DUF1772 domain-containing protein n=1 Tax=Oidiodendron maius (strain Zn) TaxID=913774 RepID=A0A0C3G9M3_OIDMZ|nr:hypothetical protein OIDMADRAFT_21636 [Oidiodendron maius Zn]
MAQTTETVLQATAVVAGSFLSGAMMSLSLVAVPVFLDTDTQPSHLLAHFVRLYHYGHRLMPSLAVGTFTLYAISSYKAHAVDEIWLRPLLAGVITLSLVPFTWVTMTPTNYALFDLYDQGKAEKKVDFGQVRRLVVKWNWLHIVRSLFPLLGAVLGGTHVLHQLGF